MRKKTQTLVIFPTLRNWVLRYPEKMKRKMPFLQ